MILVGMLILFYSCKQYTGDRHSVEYNEININFDVDHNCNEILRFKITDSLILNKLNRLKNNYKPRWIGSYKGLEFIIKLYYKNTNDIENKLLVKIYKDWGSDYSIIYGTGTIFDRSYYNDEFYDYVCSLIKIKEVMNYKGMLDQKKYEKYILKKID